MKQLILGGVRSGKSALAQQRAQNSKLSVTYVATATAGDAEMTARISRHQADRPSHWQLVEAPFDLAGTLTEVAAEDRCILVDCLTLWLNNLLSLRDEDLFQQHRQALFDVLPQLPGQQIFVSNEINMGVVPMGELSRRFCDEAGWLNQAMAKMCNRVTLVIAGLPMELKGEVS